MHLRCVRTSRQGAVLREAKWDKTETQPSLTSRFFRQKCLQVNSQPYGVREPVITAVDLHMLKHKPSHVLMKTWLDGHPLTSRWAASCREASFSPQPLNWLGWKERKGSSLHHSLRAPGEHHNWGCQLFPRAQKGKYDRGLERLCSIRAQSKIPLLLLLPADPVDWNSLTIKL